ncbi:TIGR04076 family protein [Candidatus Bathyarchaeota archaeon]|nr:TIGR04076 family protein [Candidatus Bathyarchaeota archaeon]
MKAKYSGPCPVFEEGQEYSVDDIMPTGFCPYAWAVLRNAIITLRANGNFSDWYEEPGVAVLCCPDGLRPVIFKIERV